ncbi:DUF1972 domain-containing protein [Candidatus Pseudothioglobus singularis]|uniref:Glycosyl transferase n=1 Tax=Candidatus Pseudothioglobus singularis PS1 TaxID=1125411 RepID=A0A0M3T279_9GAMM|nr:DUF1972 domain-containing protein [Candidatus Pseudothioglobus singularis]ALE02295.1 glycosyl transferase [Candidatus Pseudothioglobus singularis PS1]
MRKKISIVGTVGLPAKYGGWETLANNLVDHLSSRFDITVYCSKKKYPTEIEEFNGAKLKYINLNANGIQSILYDIVSIYKSLKFADTIIVLGVSGCIFLPLVKFYGKSQLIVNIDGLEWKRDKWGKFAKLFLKFSERIAVKFANIVVTDNKAIQKYVLDQYNVNSVFIPYGGDHANSEGKDDFIAIYDFLNFPYAFSVCRIEPENNIDMILKTFKSNDSYPLVIVGNWSNSNYGLKLKQQYKNQHNIYLIDSIYDQKKLDILRSNCTIYIHGHSAGGTNPSLVEAMNLGLPIVAYDVEYNQKTTFNMALYFKDTQELFEIISGLDKIDLSKISSDMKSLAEKHYTWLSVSEKYAKIL